MISISLLDKAQFPAVAPAVFAMLDGNMRPILPDRLPQAEEYRLWFQAVSEGLTRDPRQIILVHGPENKLLGFVQYYANEQVLMLEEVQLLPRYHKAVSFLPRLGRFLLKALPATSKYVEAFVHPQNTYSIALQEKLTMECTGTDRSGEYLHYRGAFSQFAAHFLRKEETE